MLKTILLLVVTVVWTILLIVIELFIYEPYVELVNIILGTCLAGIISYDSCSNSNDTNIYRVIAGLTEIILGFIFILFSFSLIHSAIILLIGGQLIGISIAKTLQKQKSTILSSSTQKPETLDPEPGPEPHPF